MFFYNYPITQSLVPIFATQGLKVTNVYNWIYDQITLSYRCLNSTLTSGFVSFLP